MKRSLDWQLEHLGSQMIKMGALCEEAIDAAAKCLQNADQKLAAGVFETDASIDHMEHEIEGLCMRLILTRQPVAGDLRAVTAAMRMAADMERIGDQAADVTEILRYADLTCFAGATHILQMAKASSAMVTEAIDSYVRRDASRARAVIASDDEVDALFVRVRQELIGIIAQEPASAVQCMDLLMIAKYFERIADHAQNIAEWVVYTLEGSLPARDDVRGGR